MNLNYLEIVGTLVGLFYLWLEYRASIYLWIAGIVMPAIYIVVYYRAGLYADFGINIYYLLASFYGWLAWKYRKSVAEEKAVPITRMPLRSYLPMVVVTLFLWGAIAWVLIAFTDSTVPWMDSFTTALSVVGMWMLARKYVEQWFPWIAVDVVCCGLYWYKELFFTAVLYGMYAVIAVFGYVKWRKMMIE